MQEVRGEQLAGPRTVVVAGDVVIEHRIYEGVRTRPHTHAEQGTRIEQEAGGATLLHALLHDLGSVAPQPFSTELAMGATPEHRLVGSYSLLTPCPAAAGAKGPVWRVTRDLGYGDSLEPNTRYAVSPRREAMPASVVVVDDGALGFRHSTNRTAWPEELREGAASGADWVVLKTCTPLAQGDLWQRLSHALGDRLVVVTSASDLRQEEVGITEGLSWEHTAQDLLQELTLNQSISDLTRARHLVITLGTDGALWLSRNDDGTARCRLVFDPGGLEGAWARRVHGQVWGGMSCLVAGIVAELTGCGPTTAGVQRAPDEVGPDIGAGIVRGLSAARHLLAVGYGPATDAAPEDATTPTFPPPAVVADLLEPSFRYRVADVPASVASIGRSKAWTIASGDQDVVAGRPLHGLARRVAFFGPRALVGEVPYAVFGKLTAVDRVEIESLRGLERLVKSYENDPHPSKPLSIAVFGPPGSGKSFGVKQIAKTVLGDKVPILEFNLSQYSDPAELVGALHQVRDKVLGGTTPVVFWDEFDSREYLWLQYLLAPMQDGAFQEGQITHPIGKCVFVFAGGTSHDFANFSPREESSSRVAGVAARGGLTRQEKFRLAKGPDFVSRLSGYLNVAGPNRRQRYDALIGSWVDDDAPPDISFPVRRALLMRATGGYVGAAEDAEMDIDGGLLSAFLEIGRYEHGARSLETIMKLTRSGGQPGIRRSALPPEDQLSLHVDADEFMGLVDLDLPFKMHSEELAPAVHGFYRQAVEGQTVPYDVEFEALPDAVRADNVAAAARIPRVLALIGLVIVSKGHPSVAHEDVVARLIDSNIELLAEAEHDGWMEQKYRDGWSHGSTRDDATKTHPCLVRYAILSEQDKDKDRNAVRHYPDIVALSGHKIVEAGCTTATPAQRANANVMQRRSGGR
ncbi:MAG TPA: RyR domain-containing protein [Humibacillus xanthopallidus]|nr:RyR domain-containing protein [Humibacillus xanthopallidus]